MTHDGDDPMRPTSVERRAGAEDDERAPTAEAPDADEDAGAPPPAISPIVEPPHRASVPPPPSSRLGGGSRSDAVAPGESREWGRLDREAQSTSADPADVATSGAWEVSDAPVVEAARRPRRRRSMADTPPIPTPTEFPDDAAGRVLLIAGATPGVAGPVEGVTSHASASPPGALVALISEGWVAVGALGALLLVVFVLGCLATR